MYSLDIWYNTKINKCTSDRILVLSVTPPLPCWYFSLACLGERRRNNITKYFNQVQNFYENVSFQRNNAKCELLLYFYELSYNINIKHIIQNIQLAIAAAQYCKNTLKNKIITSLKSACAERYSWTKCSSWLLIYFSLLLTFSRVLLISLWSLSR